MFSSRTSTSRFTARHRLTALFLSSCCMASLAVAEVYKVVDEQGRVTYTDSPPKDRAAEKLELRQANTLPRTRVTTKLSPPEQEQPAIDYEVRITYPPDEFHVNPGMRDLSVQVAVNPPLHAGHRLQITDNGEPVEGTTLENIVVRGQHHLQAKVVDEQGRVISQSSPVHFYVHRPTVAR